MQYLQKLIEQIFTKVIYIGLFSVHKGNENNHSWICVLTICMNFRTKEKGFFWVFFVLFCLSFCFLFLFVCFVLFLFFVFCLFVCLFFFVVVVVVVMVHRLKGTGHDFLVRKNP